MRMRMEEIVSGDMPFSDEHCKLGYELIALELNLTC